MSDIKILVVDDHNLSQKLMSKQLEVLGYTNVEIASNGEGAMEKMDEQRFDIVLLDWAMPVMDGLEFLEQFKKRKDFKDVAILMISSEAQPDLILEALEAGAVSYLTKPVTQQELSEALDKIVGYLNKKAGNE